MLSWGQNSVLVNGQEWLQPVDFTGYTYSEVSSVCPGGACSGSLPGSQVDLTGYTWASILDVSRLFNAYGASPPFTEPFQFRTGAGEESAFARDFEQTFNDCFGDCPVDIILVSGMVRDAAAAWARGYSAAGGVGEGGGFINTVAFAEGDPFFPADGDDGLGVWFFRQVENPPPPPEENFVVNLEEPINLETHSGIGNLRGWAIAIDGIDRVEIFIDGEYLYDAPYGGERTDVAEAYPDIEDSNRSGFSLAFGYSNLEIGEHTITARAITDTGEFKDSTATFDIQAFHKDFIGQWKIVDVSRAELSEGDAGEGNAFSLGDVWIDGKNYSLGLKWRAAEQGFEIISITPEN